MATESLPAEQLDLSSVSDILEHHRAHAIGGRLNLISVLQAIQNTYGYLPESALQKVAAETGDSINRLYSLASFYKSFSFVPQGDHVVSICMGTACHVRKASGLVDEFTTQLGIEPGETSGDGEFSLETVNCLGACALGPVAVVDGTYHPKLKPMKIKGLIRQLRKGVSGEDLLTDPRIFPITVSCPHCGASLMDEEHPIDDHPSCHFGLRHQDEGGEVWLSSLWGSSNRKVEHGQLDDGETPEFFCPSCQETLVTTIECPQCEAPQVPMRLGEGDGLAIICSRQGCPEHLLDLQGTSLQ